MARIGWPARDLLALGALLLATAAGYLSGLTANGYANAFYSAAAQAGSQSWSAFFYGASDAAGSITVDKPPAAVWVTALSVRLFGLNSAAILVPQVLMGVAAVAVVYLCVRRYAGHPAGMLAGIVLALTPVAVLMFRFNNPDALLVLLLTLATWATLRAVEHGSARWLVWTGVFLGVGFLTKTLQAMLLMPVLGAVYLLAAPGSLTTRLRHSLAAFGAFLVSAGWWVAVVELVPTDLRPYIGGSQTNSFLELTFGYNGWGRLNGAETGSVGGGNGWGSTGLGRLFDGSNGGQISWLMPNALIFLAVGLWQTRRAPRTDLRRASYLVWGGWLLLTGLVFSLMAGIFHEYYSVALAPPIAALVGLGASDAWRQRRSTLGTITLAVTAAAAAIWSFVLLTRTGDSYGPLRAIVLVVGTTAALMLLVADRLGRRVVPLVAAAALVAGLAGPTAYAYSTVTRGYSGSIVTAGPDTGTGGLMGRAMPPGRGPARGPADGAPGRPPGADGMGGLLNARTTSAAVVQALQTDPDRFTWVAAAIGSQNAAGLQLATGLPVMAVGGFNGSDPSPTLEQFQEYVRAGRIHYFAASERGGPGGGSAAATAITEWVSSTFQTVTIDGSAFYDLTAPLATS